MSRLSTLSTNPVIREYSQGVATQNVSLIGEFIAPTVPVATAVGKFKKWDSKSRLVIPETKRALKGEATVVGFDLSDGDYNCTPHALDFPVDVEESTELDSIVSIVNEGADIISQLAGMRHEKDVLDAALANASTAAGTGITTGTLDAGATTDPIKAIDQVIIQVIKGAKGLYANAQIRMVWGITALEQIKNHPLVRARFVTPGSKNPGPINPTNDQLMGLFIQPAEIKTSLLVTDANANLDAASIDFQLGNKLLVYVSTPNPTRYDTGFMKTFRKRGAYMVPKFWERGDGRVSFAGFDWSEQVQVTNASAGALMTVTIG
jgi:hypothetical protein